jgi:magnesium chelatase subunit I
MMSEQDAPSSPEPKENIPQMNPEGEQITTVQSLKELIDLVSGRSLASAHHQEDSGYAEILPYPFLGLVGQTEMKLALLLALINPAVGGVILIGPRGTGKTTAVRSLLDLLPEVPRSTCFYGCLPEDIEKGGIDAVCPDCAKKYAEGKPLVKPDRVRLSELPLNARLDDVIGGIDERAVLHERFRLKRGILANSDQNILYVDEVNLLPDEIIDAILDAAAQGSYTIRRGAMSATYKARCTLVGSMNPEEGNLRPQIMDRFGLRVLVRGLVNPKDRLEAYQRVRVYRQNPHKVITEYAYETSLARKEIETARELINEVELPIEVATVGIALIQHLQIDSLRAEITLFEASRAYAAAEGRKVVNLKDIRTIAPLALRLRKSEFMTEYFKNRSKEDDELDSVLKIYIPES